MRREHQSSDSQDQSIEPAAIKMKNAARLLPKKKDYRMRAHINPLNTTPFPFPANHSYVDWKRHYPAYYQKQFQALEGSNQEDPNFTVYCNTIEHPAFYEHVRDYPITKPVTVVDIGCGYGGLLFGLSPILPNQLLLGMEIRDKLVNFVGEKIRGYRATHEGEYGNLSVVRTNTMRHLCQYFARGSLNKIFICFPDPHFKQKNHRRRIINTGYLSQYAYLLKTGGLLYYITDVKELHQWHLSKLREHRMFAEMGLEQTEKDPCVQVMYQKTEEGQKVERNAGDKFYAVFRRV